MVCRSKKISTERFLLVQGAANLAASLLLRLLDGGNAAAVVAINDCIIETGNIEAAITLACELFVSRFHNRALTPFPQFLIV